MARGWQATTPNQGLSGGTQGVWGRSHSRRGEKALQRGVKFTLRAVSGAPVVRAATGADDLVGRFGRSASKTISTGAVRCCFRRNRFAKVS